MCQLIALCIALVANIYVQGTGKQRLYEDFQRIMTAVYNSSWTPKPPDWDWRASFEREWLEKQQTFIQARKLITPPHMRKFKYFSPTNYKEDMRQSNYAKFTEKVTQSSKYPTYPTLPPGYSHTFISFNDILGPNPYNWSKETMDYALDEKKQEKLYLAQQKELAGNRNKTILKQLYNEWLQVDYLRKHIRRQKRNINNDNMETGERRLFEEYEQFHKDVSEFVRNEDKKKSSTEGVIIKEERHKRHVDNNEQETQEKQLIAEYEQFNKDVSEFIREQEQLKKCRTEGIVIKEEKRKENIKNGKHCSTERSTTKNTEKIKRDKITQDRQRTSVEKDEIEFDEKQMFAEYEQFNKDVSEFIKGQEKLKKFSTKDIGITGAGREKNAKNEKLKECSTQRNTLNRELNKQVTIKDKRHNKNGKTYEMQSGHKLATENKKGKSGIAEHTKKRKTDMYAEYEAFNREVEKYIEEKYKRNGTERENSDEQETSEEPTRENNVNMTTKESSISSKGDIFDDLGSIDRDGGQTFSWNNTILDDLGPNWEGTTLKRKFKYKEMRDDRMKNAVDVDFRNMSWDEIDAKYGLPLYATDSPPLNESLRKTINADKYCELYDVIFPDKFTSLDNITVASLYRNAPNDTPLPPHLTKAAQADMYDDFYNFMFKDHFKKHYTFGKAQNVYRNCETSPPLSTKTVNHDDFFQWYDQEFTLGHRDIDVITPHPLFAIEDGTPIPPHLTKILDPEKFDEEYDVVFGHRKKFLDWTPNKEWDNLNEAAERPTEPSFTFYDSAFGDMQEKKNEITTEDILQKALNMPEQDPEPGISEEERAFLKDLAEVKKNVQKENPNMVMSDSVEDTNKYTSTKKRVKRHLSRALDKLQQLTLNSNLIKTFNNEETNLKGTDYKGSLNLENAQNKNDEENNVKNKILSNEKLERINFNVKSIFGTRRPSKHKIVRREERTSIHIFEFLKRGEARRKRRYTTTKTYRPIFFDTNDSYVIFRNYMERVTNGEISDFDNANAMYGEYMDRYLTAQFDMFKRMFTSTPFSRPTWTRRTGYTDSFGRTFTFDPNYTYTTPWEEIDLLQFISECRARKISTTIPTPENFYPFTGTRPRTKKMTKYLDPKWLVEFGLLTTSNVTTEKTTSMYLKNWLKFQQKAKVVTTPKPMSIYLRNYLQKQNRTRILQITPSTKKKFINILRTQKNKIISKKTTSLFYKNFILSQKKLYDYTTYRQRMTPGSTTKQYFSTSAYNLTVSNCTNINYLPEFLYYTSKRVKKFIEKYGSFAKEHMEKGILRRRIINHKNIDHCFDDHVRNLSAHIEKVDNDERLGEQETEWYDDSLPDGLAQSLTKSNQAELQTGNKDLYENSFEEKDIERINKGNRRKRGISNIGSFSNKTTNYNQTYSFSTRKVKRRTTEATEKEKNQTKTTSIFMRNFMARINLTSPKRRRFKITKRTSVSVRLVELTTNFFPWDLFGNRTIPYIMMHYYTGHENETYPPIYSYTLPKNKSWSIELEEDPFYRLRRRFMGKTKRRLSRTNKVPLGKKEFEDMFEEWKAAPLKPGLPSDMLSVQSKQLKEHVEFLSTMHYVKTYTEKLTVIDNLWKEESYSDYEKYKRPKLRTQHSMDFDNVVKYRLMKADKLRRNRINTVDSDYIIESMQYYLDDNAKKHTFTFPMGNFKTLYPRYNPFYYNRSVINSDLMVETLKGLTRNRGTLAQFDLEYRKNMTERMRNYLKQNPDKNKDEIDFDDFEDTQEGISHLYYMGMTTMLPEDLPHLNFDYIRNDYTAIDHAVFHWSIIAKKENKLSTIPYKPGESSTTSYLEYYWKTPSTLDWQRYWKYPYSTTTIKPTGPDNMENREFAQNLEKNLDQDARNKILADLEQLDSLMVQNIDTSTSRTLVWHRNGTDCDSSTLASKGTPGNVNKGRDQFSQNTINIADIIDPADISRELRRKRRKRNIEDVQSHIKNSDEFPWRLTAKPIEWKIPDSILENIHGTTLPDDIHNTKLAFKYLENCTDSEEYLNITLPNYMRDIYYGFTKCKKPKTTPVIRWSMPKQVLNLIDKGTNPIRLEAEKYIPYSIFRKKIMHIMKMKMKSYSIPFYRKRLDKTPFSLNTEEKDEIYYDSVEKHGLRHRATHNYRMVSYMFPLFSNSCERIIKDMVEGYHNVYDPPAAKRIFLRGQSSSTLKQEEYDDQWIKINPSDLLRFPPPTVYWPTINRNDVTYRPPWIKNSTRITKKKLTTTPFETESFESKDSLVKDDWVFTTEHWNDVNRANITALQIFMDRPSGQSSEFNDYCRKHGLPLDENGDPPPDWYDSQIPPDVDEAWRKVQEHNTFAPFTYSEERLGTHEEHVKKKDVKKFIERLLSNQTVNLAEEDFNETSTIIIKSRAYLSKRFSRERYYKYDAKYLEALKEMNAPKQVKPGYKDPQYKRMEKLYESNKNNKSNIFFSNIYKDGVKPGHELLRSEEEEINRPLSWEYKPNYTHVESNSRDSLENPFADPLTTTTEDPYTFIDLSDLIVTSAEKQSPTLPDIPLDFINGVLAQKSNNPRPPQSNERVFPSTTINPYTCEFIKDLMSSYELRKKNIPKDAIVAHPYGRPQPYYKKVIYDRLGAYIGTTFVSAEHTTYKSSNQ